MEFMASADLAMLAVGAGLGLVVYSCSTPASPASGRPQGASSALKFSTDQWPASQLLRVLCVTADQRPLVHGAGTPQASAPTPANAPTRQAVQVFDYEYIKANVKEADGIEAVEKAFALLADGKVDVPTPMHIGPLRNGQGDCHIKGGYIDDAATFTVKMATVSFNKNRERGLPPGSGVFCVFSAETGMPLAVFQENRYMTDLRTGAAGAVCVKHLVAPHQNTVAFIGTGIIGRAMCRASNCTAGGGAGWKQGLLYDAHSAEAAQKFAHEMAAECGFPLRVCSSAEEACRGADVIFTSTPGSSLVLKKDWLQPHATIIAAGSDQPTKQELPADVVEASQLITDITAQCKTNGELRSAPRYETFPLECLASIAGGCVCAATLLASLPTLSASVRQTARLTIAAPARHLRVRLECVCWCLQRTCLRRAGANRKPLCRRTRPQQTYRGRSHGDRCARRSNRSSRLAEAWAPLAQRARFILQAQATSIDSLARSRAGKETYLTDAINRPDGERG